MDLVMAFAVPVFLLSILVEHAIAKRHGTELHESRDTRTSLILGAVSVVAGLPFRFGFVWVLTQLYQHRFFDFEMGVASYVAFFLLEDLCYYFSHRYSHEVRLLWASHVNHHSSEHFHLATALRQPWTQMYLVWVFWLPLPLLGFSPMWILLQQTISLIFQFFTHTRFVPKLGPLEWVFNTPSHHRAHHAVNLRYLDRNHGGILIIWDRMFGTFAEEREADVPVYGITSPVRSFSPLRVVFHEWAALVRDVRRAPSLSTKLRYLFAPPGYRHNGELTTTDALRARGLGDLTSR